MHPTKQLYLFISLGIIIAASAFAWQLIQANKIIIKPVDTQLVSTNYYDIKIEDDDFTLGNPGAPLTVVLFGDYSCSDCQKKYSEITTFVKAHPQDVRMFLKNFPKGSLFFKANDLPERAAFCAGKQNNFWQFADAINEGSNKTDQKGLEQIANDLKLDTTQWSDCLTSDEATQKIKRVVDMSQTLGISTLPTIYINNKKITLEKDLDITNLLTRFIAK